jgi:predicted signal transduction protein with EAL and GGDEF domain
MRSFSEGDREEGNEVGRIIPESEGGLFLPGVDGGHSIPFEPEVDRSDPVTGLPRREGFLIRLERLLAGAAGGVVEAMSIGLDGLETIHEVFGCDAVDAALRSVADRLQGYAAADGGILAQTREGMFLYARTDVRDGPGAAELLALLRQPIELEGREWRMTANVGVSRYPNDAAEAEELVRFASMAMFDASRRNRARCVDFREEMRESFERKAALEACLRHAVARDQLSLRYQPIFRGDTLTVAGLECLVRWFSPELGHVAPSEFIPAAEEADLVEEIGEWVLREACRQNKAWQRDGLAVVPISVNLCPKQFYNPSLKEHLLCTLRSTGLSPELLELEITESMSMDVELAMETVADIRSIGVRMAIDDFGTGYSSLRYLQKLPIDKLKIDQSFVKEVHRSPENGAIVRMIVEMARRMRLSVVAEGVESREDSDWLRRMNCDLLQGYYFSEPLDADRAAELLRSGRRGE